MCHVNNWNSFHFYYFRIVTGPPEDDPKGRWRHGGGKNVPAKVTLKLEVKQAWEIKRKLESCGLAVSTRTTA